MTSRDTDVQEGLQTSRLMQNTSVGRLTQCVPPNEACIRDAQEV